MLRAALNKLKQLTVEPVPFDPSSLGDEIALKTSWEPAKGGGANFQTHRLIEIDSYRTEFRAAPGLVVFAGVFMLIGIGASSIMVLANQGQGSLVLIFPILIGLLFAAVGGGMMYWGLAPIVFDKRRGEYWKGRTAPYEAANRQGLKHYTELDEIRALQIIKER